MKKKFMGMAMVLASALLAGNVHAAVLDKNAALTVTSQYGPFVGYEGSNVTVTKGENGVYQVQLTGEAKQDLVILSGEKAVIDLNGKTLEAFSAGCSAIDIQSGATVIIKDATGKGVIKRKSEANNNASTISNAGTLTIEGGTIEASGATNAAGIWNQENATLTMTGGTIKTTTNGVWGINNAGTATISGGNFIQGNDYSVILNEKDMKISGGTFKTESEGTHNSLLTNGYSNTNATLAISNGSFNHNLILWNGDGSHTGGKVTITGGEFSNTDAISKYLGSGYTISNGKVVKKTTTVASSEESKKEEEVVSVEETSVSLNVTTIKTSDTTYKEMLEKVTEKGYKTVFGAYELTTVSNIGEEGITLVFKVGTDNNGKAAYVLHQKKDGTFEEFNEVVKDGLVKITVKELSPFMIALGSVVKDDEMPKTSDIFPQVIVGLMALGLAGTYTYKKLHE